MPTLDLTNRKPQAELDKLPGPTNGNLKLLFAEVDTVIIKHGGVSNGKAMSDQVMLVISEENNVKAFCDLLGIDESNTGFYCMCLGTYAIELVSISEVKATIGFHHGVSIRYHGWNGDAELARSEELLTFLADLGFTKPLTDRLEEKRRAEADVAAEREWLEVAPRCFSKYFHQIKTLDTSYFPQLMDELKSEYPDKQKRILVLLQTFGKSNNYWTAYPSYEELPSDILKSFETQEIIGAYVTSDRNYKIRRGLGRFLCSYDFKKERKKHLKFIPLEVVDDLEKCFDQIGEKRGINEIFSLRNEIKKQA
jgi:hypothetical protein